MSQARAPIGGERKRFTSIAGFSDRQSLRRVAKLRLGIKKQGSSGEHPVETDHFVLDVEDWVPPANAAEIRKRFEETYGKRPAVITGARFASSDREDVFSSDYEWWGAGKLKCHGDGNDAQRKIDGKWVEWTPTHPCANGGCPDYAPKKCGPQHRFRFLLPLITLQGYFQIDTGSIYSARNINDGLTLIEVLTAQILGEPRIDRVSLVINRAPQKIEFEGKLNEHYTINLSMEPNSLDGLRKQLAETAPPAERRQIAAAPIEILPTEDDMPTEQVPSGSQREEEVFDPDAQDEIDEAVKLLKWNVGTIEAKQAQFPRQSEMLAHVREEVAAAIARLFVLLAMPKRDEEELRQTLTTSHALLTDLVQRWDALPAEVRKAKKASAAA